MLLCVKGYGFFLGHPLVGRDIALHIRATAVCIACQQPVHLGFAVGNLRVDVLVKVIRLLQFEKMYGIPGSLK